MGTTPLDDAPGYWLNLAFNATRREAITRFREAGWDGTPEQWAILVRLWDEDGRPMRALVDGTLKDKAGVTRLVDQLEKRGYVMRQPDPDDGRGKRVWLTDAGRALEAQLVPVVEAVRDEAFGVLDDAELAQLLSMLRRIHGALQG